MGLVYILLSFITRLEYLAKVGIVGNGVAFEGALARKRNIYVNGLGDIGHGKYITQFYN